MRRTAKTRSTTAMMAAGAWFPWNTTGRSITISAMPRETSSDCLTRPVPTEYPYILMTNYAYYRLRYIPLSSWASNTVLTGTVRNVIDFGVFVDIGGHQDGLVHISQLSDHYVKHPMDVVQVGDIVTVKVLAVDVSRKRISLTMKGL